MSRLSNPANAESLKGSMTGSGTTVKLPFAAPNIWWKNGNPDLSDTDEIKDARRFGGWGVSKEDVDEQRQALPPELPANWKYFESLKNSEGGSYSAYLARSVWVAPIDRRFNWFTNRDTGKSSSKVNYLVYLAVRNESKLLPWGPAILSAGSYSGKALDESFSEFKKVTASLRGDDPVNLFYHPLGTFSNEPKFDKRTGKGGQSSSITPCQLWKPEGGIVAATLDDWFVGDEIAAEMGLLRVQAHEWLEEWNKKKVDAVADEQMPPLPVESDFPF